MPDNTLTEFVQHIQALLTRPTTTGDDVLTAASQAAYLAKKYQNQVNSEVQRYTFDRSTELELVPADYCLVGIGTLCNVKATTCRRTEHTLYGGQKTVRLLALTGTPANVEFAIGLYDMIDGTIERAVTEFEHSHRHSTEKDWAEFRSAMAGHINTGLKNLAIRHAEAPSHNTKPCHEGSKHYDRLPSSKSSG